MASGLLVILDDIAAMFDDVAAMSKLATKKIGQEIRFAGKIISIQYKKYISVLIE